MIRRNKVEQLLHVINIIKEYGPLPRTRAMGLSNTCWLSFQPIMARAIELDLLKLEKHGRYEYVELTDKGRQVCWYWKNLRRLMGIELKIGGTLWVSTEHLRD